MVTTRHGGRYLVALTQREDGFWVVPKGRWERDKESLLEGALREVWEEVGIASGTLRFVAKLDEYVDTREAVGAGGRAEEKVVHIFHFELIVHELPSLRPDVDHIESEWWPIDELPVLKYPQQEILLSELADLLTSSYPVGPTAIR